MMEQRKESSPLGVIILLGPTDRQGMSVPAHHASLTCQLPWLSAATLEHDAMPPLTAFFFGTH